MSSSADSSGNNEGSDYTDLKSLLIFGIAYGVANTIAVKTIDWFASGRSKEGERKIASTIDQENYEAVQRKLSIPVYCKHIMEFYKDCLKDKHNNCDGFHKVIKRCHEAGADPGNNTAVSHPPLDPALLLKSYYGCGEYYDYKIREAHRKKYLTYLKEINAVFK